VLADVELAGHGGGDKGSAVFAEERDGGLDLRAGVIYRASLGIDVPADGSLFSFGRKRDDKVPQCILPDVLHRAACSGCLALDLETSLE